MENLHGQDNPLYKKGQDSPEVENNSRKNPIVIVSTMRLVLSLSCNLISDKTSEAATSRGKKYHFKKWKNIIHQEDVCICNLCKCISIYTNYTYIYIFIYTLFIHDFHNVMFLYALLASFQLLFCGSLQAARGDNQPTNRGRAPKRAGHNLSGCLGEDLPF